MTLILMIIGILAASLPSKVEAAGTIMVKGTYVNVRSSANIASSMIGKVYKGETFPVVKESQGWYQIQLKNGRKGWVAGWLVREVVTKTGQSKISPNKVEQTKNTVNLEPVTTQKTGQSGLVTVKGTYVNLRSGPATSYTLAGKVLKGETIQVLQGLKDWYQVRLGDGRTGWVAGWLVAQKVQTGLSVESAKTQVEADNTGLEKTVGNSPENGNSQRNENNQGKENGQNNESSQSKENGREQGDLQENGVNNSSSGGDLSSGGNSGSGDTAGNSAGAATIQFPRPARISSTAVNLRSGPGSDTVVLTKLGQGTWVEAQRQEGSWLEVKLSDGTMGWVAGWLVKFVGKTNRIELRVETGELNKVTIMGSEPLVYETAEKQEPNRLMVKIFEAGLSGTAQEIAGGQQGLVKVTSGLAEGDTTSVQINLELEPGVKWMAKPGDSDKMMVLVPGDSQDSGQAGNGTGNSQSEAGLNLRTVVIDPGHGGIDPGAIGPNKLQEKDVTFDISKRVGQKLEAAGYRVVYTRTDDTKISLARRPAIAAENNAEIFVSIHANSSESPLTNGTSTYYYAPAGIPNLAAQEAERKRLAQTVQSRMIAAVGRKDLGIMQANFAVLRGTAMPSILVETAYLSYREEEALLSREDIREQFAQAIFEGIKQYFGESTPAQ
ncbi:MAG: N-acetylmuramoyl-L-alanine amidase [Clostridia bacterium]|nr:N-acetylmuramoyl-L-alanine amidase [Clostridia bacterium]